MQYKVRQRRMLKPHPPTHTQTFLTMLLRTQPQVTEHKTESESKNVPLNLPQDRKAIPDHTIGQETVTCSTGQPMRSIHQFIQPNSIHKDNMGRSKAPTLKARTFICASNPPPFIKSTWAAQRHKASIHKVDLRRSKAQASQNKSQVPRDGAATTRLPKL